MKNIFYLLFNIVFLIISYPSLSTTMEADHLLTSGFNKTRLYNIMDAKEFLNLETNYFSAIDGINDATISADTLAEFYTSLADFYCVNEDFKKAGEAYHRALKLPVYDEILNKFISSRLRLNPLSASAEAIGKKLAELEARASRK